MYLLTGMLMTPESTDTKSKSVLLSELYLLKYVVQSHIITLCEDVAHVVTSSSRVMCESLVESQRWPAVKALC